MAHHEAHPIELAIVAVLVVADALAVLVAAQARGRKPGTVRRD